MAIIITIIILLAILYLINSLKSIPMALGFITTIAITIFLVAIEAYGFMLYLSAIILTGIVLGALVRLTDH